MPDSVDPTTTDEVIPAGGRLADRKAAAAAAADDTPADTNKEVSTDEDAPLADQGEFSAGMWGDSGVPLFKCPYCPHAIATKRGDGPGTIELHILGKIDSGDQRHMRALDKK